MSPRVAQPGCMARGAPPLLTYGPDAGHKSTVTIVVAIRFNSCDASLQSHPLPIIDLCDCRQLERHQRPSNLSSVPDYLAAPCHMFHGSAWQVTHAPHVHVWQVTHAPLFRPQSCVNHRRPSTVLSIYTALTAPSVALPAMGRLHLSKI